MRLVRFCIFPVLYLLGVVFFSLHLPRPGVFAAESWPVRVGLLVDTNPRLRTMLYAVAPALSDREGWLGRGSYTDRYTLLRPRAGSAHCTMPGCSADSVRA